MLQATQIAPSIKAGRAMQSRKAANITGSFKTRGAPLGVSRAFPDGKWQKELVLLVSTATPPGLRLLQSLLQNE
jgi:hypothetical protein